MKSISFTKRSQNITLIFFQLIISSLFKSKNKITNSNKKDKNVNRLFLIDSHGSLLITRTTIIDSWIKLKNQIRRKSKIKDNQILKEKNWSLMTNWTEWKSLNSKINRLPHKIWKQTYITFWHQLILKKRQKNQLLNHKKEEEAAIWLNLNFA